MEIDTSGDKLYWCEALAMVCLERFLPVLDRMGVAERMSARFLGPAQEYQRAVVEDFRLARASPPGMSREAGEARFRPRLARFFSEVAASAGDPAARDLAWWMRRFFIDRVSSRQWFIWHGLFQRVAGRWRADPIAELPFGEPKRSLLTAVIADWSREGDRDDAWVEHVTALPSSALEREITGCQPQLVELAVQRLPGLFHDARAQSTLRELILTGLLDSQDLEPIVGWAHAQLADPSALLGPEFLRELAGA